MRRSLLSTFCLSLFLLFSDNLEAQDLKADKIDQGITLHSSSVLGTPVPCVDGVADGFECLNIDLVSRLTLEDISGLDAADNVRTTGVNDIWGWVDSSSNDLYAIVGRNDGTSFIRMTDPETQFI